MELIKIPVQRVGTLLGARRETQKLIEKKCKVKLRITAEGEVEMDGEEADVYFAREVVQAIGRGFEPAITLRLLKEDYQFYQIDLKEYAHTVNSIHRIKGRVIGEDGRIKKEIEQATDSFLSIYGNTIGIISKMDSIEYAKEAVSRLIHGAQHVTVLKYLAGVRRKLMSERLGAGPR